MDDSTKAEWGGWLDLGALEQFVNFPARVSIGGRSFFVTRGDTNEFLLLAAACPHLGGEVVDVGSVFECPNHGWHFSKRDGRCLNPQSKRLPQYPVRVVNGRLLAEVPKPELMSRSTRRLRDDDTLKIKLLHHAALDVTCNGFSLLMDPWLRGPCFLGAWIHYPPSSVDFGDLHPNAIWITHEHSDHFHPGTLEAFNRSTPMFVPDFPDGRLPSRLASMGFSNIRRVPFGEPIALAPECRLTAFEPGSIWNDSIVLLEVAGFRILNLSDAGVNQRIADLVGSVDMITTAYSAASSSYPFTWNHLTRQQKQEIFKRATRGALQMVVGAVRLYRAKYVLPFADHFTLWHPSHREYVEMMPPLTAADVADALEPCDGVKVIDLLPGESFDVVRGHRMTLWQDRSRVYEREYLLRYIAQRWDEAEFNQSFPVGRSTTESEVEDYFMTLNRTPEIAFCEDLTVTIRATNVDRTEVKLEIAFRVSGGRIARVSVPESSHELLIELPMEVLASIVREDLSWDEASIGFWCRFHRSPDVYHVGFWRLLHAPYYHRPADVPPVERRHVTRYTAIADVIERFGPDMDRVMRRGGLYCLACSHAPGETIEQGARKHGLDEHAIERLLTEMNSVACGAADPIREASSDFN